MQTPAFAAWEAINMTTEQSAIARATMGLSDHAMTGAWRVIIARTPEKERAWYYHAADHKDHARALKEQALRWLMS